MVTMHLGVDGGGTSTRAVLVTPDGSCVGYGTSGGGNPVSWGPAVAMKEIARAVKTAQKQASDMLPEGTIGQATLALAGASSFSTPGAFAGELTALGVKGDVVIASDLLGTFCAGTASTEGYAVVSGTGAAAIRVRDGVVITSADGLGWMLGDAGSGYWIGHKVVRSALASLEGRGPATSMAQPVIEQLGLPDVNPGDTRGLLTILRGAVETLYQWRPVELAKLAPIAFTAALRDDDMLAWKILREARRELTVTLGAVLQENLAGPVVLGGTVAAKLPDLRESIVETMELKTGYQPDVVTVPDGAVGAAVLALRSAGITVDETIHQRMSQTINARR